MGILGIILIVSGVLFSCGDYPRNAVHCALRGCTDEYRREQRGENTEDEGPESPEWAEGPVGRRGPRGKTGTPGTPGEDGIDGQQGSSGHTGSPGEDGQDGTGFNATGIIINDINRSLPWSISNNASIDNPAVVVIVTTFQVDAITSTDSPHGGWIDIIAGPHTFCYQREKNKRRYALVYKKVEGYSLGCDSNNEKNTGGWTTWPLVDSGDLLQVIPRDVKLSGILWDMEFTVLEEEE